MYEVIEVLLDKYHPMFPHEVVYKLRNTKTNQVSLGCYTTKSVAYKVVERLENEDS